MEIAELIYYKGLAMNDRVTGAMAWPILQRSFCGKKRKITGEFECPRMHYRKTASGLSVCRTIINVCEEIWTDSTTLKTA